MIENLSSQCMDWWKSALQSIAELNGKVLQSYSDTDLMNQMKLGTRPCAGLLYEGIVASADNASSTAKLGISGTLGVSIILLVDGKSAGSERGFDPAVALLDKIRSVGIGQRSPTGHHWRYVAEGQATEKSGVVVWIQRWAAPIQLVR
jgi:hypothetical protein